jgi:intein/homing endonuclease
MSQSQLKISANIEGVGGKAFLHDVQGHSYRVSELSTILERGPLKVTGFDTESWQSKTVRILSCQEEKPVNLRKITTVNSLLDIHRNCSVYTNKNGDLSKVSAGNIIAGDLLLMPKTLSFSESNFQIEDVFPNKKGSLIKQRANGKLHQAHASMSINFLMGLSFISGLIDCKGSYNIENGDILFSTKSDTVNGIFAHIMSSCFLVEPEINNDVVRVQNKVIAMLIDGFLKVVASQNKDIVANYLAGYFHASNSFGFLDKEKHKPFVSLCRNEDSSANRLCKCLLIFSIVPFRSSTSYLIVDVGHIEQFLTSIPYLMKTLVARVDNYMAEIANKATPVISLLGYKFGKSLLAIKKDFGITADKYEKIAVYEQDHVIMNHDMAYQLNRYIKKKSTQSSLSKLIDSSVVGIKVIKVEDVLTEKTFTITCDDSCGIFLNNILCTA